MRTKLVVLLAFIAAFGFALAPFAHASSITFAQADTDDGAEQSDPGTDTEGGAGESDEGGEDAETGAGEGEQGAAEEETGPQWTYQMSRITLAMLLLLFLAMGALYYRMIGRRQGGV